MRVQARFTATVGSVMAASALVFAAEYRLTVSQERLNNAINEPQNWLLMNGDYGATRYSKLTQINRDNVKNLRMVWALALRGMQDVGQNGPENEVNPLIDNGTMYTTDGWGTVYKIDATKPDQGRFLWITDPGVQHQGNAPRTRGIALWEDRVVANLPDGRVIAINRDNGEIVWDKKIAIKNEFGGVEKFLTAPMVADGKVIIQNGIRRFRYARLGGRLGRQDRRRVVALLRRAEARRSRQRNVERRPQRLENGRRRHLADRLVRSRHQALHRRHRQSLSHLRSAVSPGRQLIYRLGYRAERRHRQAGLALSNTPRTTRGTTTRSASTCSTTS